MIAWKWHIGWWPCGEMRLRPWLLDWGWYGFTGFVRILGCKLQVYRKASLHPLLRHGIYLWPSEEQAFRAYLRRQRSDA